MSPLSLNFQLFMRVSHCIVWFTLTKVNFRQGTAPQYTPRSSFANFDFPDGIYNKPVGHERDGKFSEYIDLFRVHIYLNLTSTNFSNGKVGRDKGKQGRTGVMWGGRKMNWWFQLRGSSQDFWRSYSWDDNKTQIYAGWNFLQKNLWRRW